VVKNKCLKNDEKRLCTTALGISREKTTNKKASYHKQIMFLLVQVSV